MVLNSVGNAKGQTSLSVQNANMSNKNQNNDFASILLDVADIALPNATENKMAPEVVQAATKSQNISDSNEAPQTKNELPKDNDNSENVIIAPYIVVANNNIAIGTNDNAELAIDGNQSNSAPATASNLFTAQMANDENQEIVPEDLAQTSETNEIVQDVNPAANQNIAPIANTELDKAVETLSPLNANEAKDLVANLNLDKIIQPASAPQNNNVRENSIFAENSNPKTNSKASAKISEFNSTNEIENNDIAQNDALLPNAATIGAKDNAQNSNNGFQSNNDNQPSSEIKIDNIDNISNDAAPSFKIETNHNLGETAQANNKMLNVPVLAATIVRQAQNGEKSFFVRLDPSELGSVSIELKLGTDKKMRAIIGADRSDTLSEIAKSSANISQALKDAGFDLAENGLSFNLENGANQSQSGFNAPSQNNNDFNAQLANNNLETEDNILSQTDGRNSTKLKSSTIHSEIWQKARISLVA